MKCVTRNRRVIFVSIIATVAVSMSTAGSEEEPEPAHFREDWVVLGIIGDVAQIRDYLGAVHYKAEGESLEGVDIVRVDAEEMFIRVRDQRSGAEKTIPGLEVRTKPKPRPVRPGDGEKKAPERESVQGRIQGIVAGEPQGLETELATLRVEAAPLRDLLNLLAKQAGLDLVIEAGVPKTPITASLKNTTVREFLGSYFQASPLVLDLDEGKKRITVLTPDALAARNTWEWERVACETLTATAAVRAMGPLLEATETIKAGEGANTVAILASPERSAALRAELLLLESQMNDFLEKRRASLGEAFPELDSKIPVFQVDNRPIREVVSLLSRFSRFDFVLHHEVEETRITAKLENTTVREILDTILPLHGFRWQPAPSGRIIWILPAGTGSELGPRTTGTPPPQTKSPTWSLDTEVQTFEVENRPIREVLNLLSRWSNVSFATTAAVPNIPVTARMTRLTVRQILDTLLPAYGLTYVEKPAVGLVLVMTKPEHNEFRERIAEESE